MSFVLVSVALGLGLASTQRMLASPRWPRFATQTLHRNVSLLGLAFLLMHIVVTVADSYVDIGWITALVPGTSGYEPLWVSFGTIAFDLIVVVIVTSLLRGRMSARSWRWLHYTVYAAWPMSWLHFLKTGTDAQHGRFGLWIAIASAAFVGAAVGARTSMRDEPAPVRSVVR